MIFKVIIAFICVCALYVMWSVLKADEEERTEVDTREAERRENTRRRREADEIEASRQAYRYHK